MVDRRRNAPMPEGQQSHGWPRTSEGNPKATRTSLSIGSPGAAPRGMPTCITDANSVARGVEQDLDAKLTRGYADGADSGAVPGTRLVSANRLRSIPQSAGLTDGGGKTGVGRPSPVAPDSGGRAAASDDRADLSGASSNPLDF